MKNKLPKQGLDRAVEITLSSTSKPVKSTKKKRAKVPFVPKEGATLVEVVRNKKRQRVGVLVGVLLGDHVYVHGTKCNMNEDKFDYAKGVQDAVKRAKRLVGKKRFTFMYSDFLDNNVIAVEQAKLTKWEWATGGKAMVPSLVPHLFNFVQRCCRFFFTTYIVVPKVDGNFSPRANRDLSSERINDHAKH